MSSDFLEANGYGNKSGYGNPLKLFACIISFEKGVQREKDMINKHRPHAIVYDS